MPSANAYPTEQDLAYYRSKNIAWGTIDDHMVFRDFSVPSVLLIDFYGRQPEGQKLDGYETWWHTPADDLPAMDPAALAFTGNLVMKALPQLEDFVLSRTRR